MAIVGDNRPQLYWAMVAVQCIGGVPVPLYQDAVADEIQFVLDHAETRYAVVEDQEQVDKLLSVWDACPRLEQLIYKIRGACGSIASRFCTPLLRFSPRGTSTMPSTPTSLYYNRQ